MKLRLRIKQLPDGRFRVSYLWHIWEQTNQEYFDNAEEASKFIARMITQTMWG